MRMTRSQYETVLIEIPDWAIRGALWKHGCRYEALDDLVHCVLMRTIQVSHQTLSHFENATDVRGYVDETIRQVASEWLELEVRAARLSGGQDTHDTVTSTADLPEDDREFVVEAIEKLDEHCRQVVELYIRVGKIADVATELGIAEPEVTANLMKAARHVAKLYERSPTDTRAQLLRRLLRSLKKKGGAND